jgi:coiled-coil domain-containing protein 102
VRNERNQARDEAKQLRAQLEVTMKESNGFKREKHDLEIQVQQLKKEMEKIHHSLIKHASTTCKDPEPDLSGSPDQYSNDGLKNVNSEDGLVTKARSFSENESNSESKMIEDYIMKGAMPKEINKVDSEIEEKQLIQKLKISKSDDIEDDSEYLIQKAKMLQLRLDDAQKAIIAEKE